MKNTFYYSIHKIPDPYQTTLVQRFNDVKSAIFDGWRSILRYMSSLEENSMFLSFCFLYTPSLKRGIQGRLQIWLKIHAPLISKDTVDNLILHGPVCEFYEFESNPEEPEVPYNSFNTVSEIVRRAELVDPYLNKIENNRVLGTYMTIKPFTPDENNDYSQFDRQISNLKHAIYYEFSVNPEVNVEEIRGLYRYLNKLESINESSFFDKKDMESKLRSEQGFRKDLIAEEVGRETEDLAKKTRLPQLEFYVRIFGESSEDVMLCASTIAESSLLEGNYRILTCNKGEELFDLLVDKTKSLEPYHFLQHHEFLANKKIEGYSRLTRIATVEELQSFGRLPVGTTVSPRTIPKTTDPEPLDDIKETILIGDDMQAGIASQRDYSSYSSLFEQKSTTTIEHRLPLKNLKKHMFICGVPGSGKTTAMFNLLVQLYTNDIPFLMLEPAKNEYRTLKQLKNHKDKNLKGLGQDLRIYTPGNDELSPFRINPLDYPEGISLDEHINNLMNCFRSAMPLEGPLPALLLEAIDLIYEQEETPYMEDLLAAVKKIMETKEYDSEIKSNLETAIQVRLGMLLSQKRSMGKVFSKTENPINISNLLRYPTVIEMDSLGTEQSNLLTLFILTILREHIKVTRSSGSPLKHIIVLEEAHNIVGRVQSDNPDDPRIKAAQYIERMLAELRAVGEGILIADQLPSTVASTVIKNTGTKLVHRLTSKDDREEIGATILADGTQIEEMARLMVGGAYYYTEKLYACRRARCINSHSLLKIGDPPDSHTLYKTIYSEKWFEPSAVLHKTQEVMLFYNLLYEYLLPEIHSLAEETLRDKVEDDIIDTYDMLSSELVSFADKYTDFDKTLSQLSLDEDVLELKKSIEEEFITLSNTMEEIATIIAHKKGENHE